MKRKTIFASIFFAAAAFMGITANAQNIEKPTIEGKTSFAVVVDQTTLDKCRAEIDSYKAVVESEGLPTFIVSGNWCCPDCVRGVLKDLYEKNNLEGAFLIGDIPIAMVTRANHLATAFKMDEREYPMGRASIPTDRFYDDFDLKFIPIKDSTDGLKHFYQMDPQSAQYIECDIYTGRLKPLAGNGDKYAQISKYLKKAVAAHKEHNHFDQFVSYTGYGSYSECLKAWRAEQQILHEQFPGVFTKYNTAKFIRFSMDPYTKDYLLREMRRPELDFMVIHAHGLPHKQALCEIPNFLSRDFDHTPYIGYEVREGLRSTRKRDVERTQALIEKWGLDSTWYAGLNTPEVLAKDSIEKAQTEILIDDINDVKPNPRFIIMDCCFNGDYRYDDFIAGKYIMADGKTVAAFANSVNVIQDGSTFDLMGLLGQGIRLGNWAKYNNILESHIIGDPTFHYTAPHGHGHAHGEGAHNHSHEINDMMANNDVDFWLAHMNAKNPEVQNVALIKLVENNYKGAPAILLERVKNSDYAIVRYNALKLLEKLNGPEYREALKVATNDGFEFTRRIAVNRMGFCGDVEFIPYLINAFVEDYNALRIKFNIEEALKCFDKNLVVAEIEKYFAGRDRFLTERFKKQLLNAVEGNSAARSLEDMKNPEVSVDDKIYRAKALRNRPFHQNVDEMLVIVQDANAAPEFRQYLVESLGWFRRSYKSNEILSVMEKMLAEKQFVTPEMEQELKRACAKLKSEK